MHKTPHKKFYRTIEDLLRRIDASAGDEAMLRAILHALVESEDAQIYGICSGRVYRERSQDFVLIASVGERGSAIEGRAIAKDYAAVQHVMERRLWVTSPRSPGYDPQLESQFTDHDSAAIAVGHNPAYILSLGLEVHDSSTDEVLVMLQSIRAAIGLKLRQSALENQLRQAQSIQMSLLPQTLPALPGFALAARSLPAEEVGGDVYDVQAVEEGMLSLMIADASGHGLPAALQARDVVIGLRLGQAHDEKISALVQRLNRVIHNTTLASRFITLFYAELEDNGNVTYVSAGHCPPLLVTPDGDVYQLPSSGPVLGPLPEATFRRRSLSLRRGEVLVLFTDGLIERAAPGEDARDDKEPKEFGRTNLVRTILANRERSAQEILEAILAAAAAFGGDAALQDDLTVLVVKRDADGGDEAGGLEPLPQESGSAPASGPGAGAGSPGADGGADPAGERR